MQSIPVYVGLDYHQQAVQVCAVSQEGRVLGNGRCSNDWQAIVEYAGRFGPVVRAAIESCTGAANLAEELVTRAGWSVDLAHPGYVSRMKQSPDKTDYSDARMLADLERVGYLPRVWMAPHEVRELRRLVRFRQQWVQHRRQIKLRVAALIRDQRMTPPSGGRWTLRWMKWLQEEGDFTPQTRWIVDRHLEGLAFVQQQIDKAEARLLEAVQEDAIVKLLWTHRGVGLITAATLRAEIGRFDRFRSGKQLARFCGLSPRNVSSGTRQADAGLIKAGNPQLRATIMEAAHRLARFDERWRDFTTRKVGEGKLKCVVIAAVANRWIRWLYHQMQEAKVAA